MVGMHLKKKEVELPVLGDWFGQWMRGAVLGGIQVLCLDYLFFQRIICDYCLHFLMLTSFLNPLNLRFYFHQSTKITHSKNISDFNVSKSNGFSFYSWAHSTTSTYLENLSPSVPVMSWILLLLLLFDCSSGHHSVTLCRTQISPSYHNSIYQILNSPSFLPALHFHSNTIFSVFPISVNSSTANLSISSPNTCFFY